MLNLKGEIPQRVHVTWKRKDVLNSISPVVLNGIGNIARLNPDWSLEISDDAEMEQYLEDHIFRQDFRNLAEKHIVEKVDLWRLLKIYHEGGVYTDIDRFCNVPMAKIIRPGIRCILPIHHDINFSHDFMISVPSNPIFMKAIELNLERRKLGYTIFQLGPDTYYDAVCLCLLGETIECPPSEQNLARLRELIQQAPDLETYREGSPDSLSFRSSGGVPWQPGNGQDVGEFFASENVKHWAGRWG
ncbi:MAG: hypothetical protein GY725_26865 [bacterium]|nr:hypothetical protein [bacterium]